MNDDTITSLATKHGSTYTNRHFLNDPRFVFTAGGLKDFVSELLAAQPQAAQAVPNEIAETMRRALVHFSDCEYEMLKASKKPAVKQTAQQNMNDADAALNWLAAAPSAPAPVTTQFRKPEGADDTVAMETFLSPAHPWRQIADGPPPRTDDDSVRVLVVTADDDFDGAQMHDIPASDFYLWDGVTAGTEVTACCTHWAYRDEVWPCEGQPERKPLTNEVIRDIADGIRTVFGRDRAIARAIEAAHGIKGDTE